MVEALTNKNETVERQNLAMSNLVIYAHQSAGREIMFKAGYLQKLLPLLTDTSEKCVSLMKICHGFCENNYMRSLAVLQIVTVEKLRELALRFNEGTDLTNNALSVVVTILNVMVDHFRQLHKLKPEDQEKNMLIRENTKKVRQSLEEVPQYKILLQFLVNLMGEKSISADGRDAIIDAFIKAIGLHKAISDYVVENSGIPKLLELASYSYFPRIKKNPPLAVNENTYVHVSVALSSIHETIKYYDEERGKFEQQSESVVNRLLDSTDEGTALQGLIAFSTIIMASRDSAHVIATKNDNINKVLVLACRDDDVARLLSAEALALAATDKTVCNAIVNNGMDVLQMLYQSPHNAIRVRGLVALCKVTMKGGGNIKDKILADDGARKLYNTCRKFLMSTKKEFGLKKWACEGLAYLTLDADVKEILVTDSEALNMLLDLAKSDDATVTYGICNALVNLTNSYDKPEKNPELEQVAKFAKQPVPEPHEKDSVKYVKKRIDTLMVNGLITALVNFSNVKSDSTKEMMSRVFCAVVEDVSHRGKVVAQGGVKTLLPLALEGTEKGIDLAAQALARIGITNDPRLAFSGQRCMEVVRPFINMLHFKKTPLLMYEGLLALTNLTSVNDEIRRRVMKEKGFQAVENLMFDEDDEIKKAATECMCNLVLNEQAFNMFKDKTATTERLKLVTIYCGEDPPELARAAAGTVAILTSDVEICRMFVEIKSHLEILKYLVSGENLELRHRGVFIVANLMESDKEIADNLIQDELFEALLALKVSKTSDNIKRELDRCFEAAQKWKVIQINPEL